jgi:hypothetical protein
MKRQVPLCIRVEHNVFVQKSLFRSIIFITRAENCTEAVAMSCGSFSPALAIYYMISCTSSEEAPRCGPNTAMYRWTHRKGIGKYYKWAISFRNHPEFICIPGQFTDFQVRYLFLVTLHNRQKKPLLYSSTVSQIKISFGICTKHRLKTLW